MAKSWIMAGAIFAKKIRNATQRFTLRFGELIAEACIKCPNCQCSIDTSNICLELPALPAGVKFDPTDLEILQHLEGKSNLPNSEPHALINEFIPTIDKVEGICYTHPKNLPGVKMDGSSCHFFHKVSNAYGSGHRKRRKINEDNHSVCDENIRWHKTGNSKAVCDENGVQKGWKKILVLYKGSKKGGSKVDRANWVMHQYHLGADADEKHGEFVVSKVFYQSKQNENSEIDDVVAESDPAAPKIDPRTPKTETPQSRRLNNSPSLTEQYTPMLDQGEVECGPSTYQVKGEHAESPASAWSDAYVTYNRASHGESSAASVASHAMWSYHVSPEPSRAELAQAAPEADDLPALEEPVQREDAPDARLEAPQPVDESDMDPFHGLPDLGDIASFPGAPSARGSLSELDDIMSFPGAPSARGSLANVPLGPPGSLDDVLINYIV